jgi:hypothetical protein
MLTYAVVVLCVAHILFCARHWMRVAGRDRDASRLRQMRESLDWRRAGHRSRIAPGVPRFGGLRGR